MHEIILTERAEIELEQQHDWWAEIRSPNQADRWYVGLLTKLLSLEQQPLRGVLAPENLLFPYQVYQLNYGLGRKLPHRALYTIKDDKVVDSTHQALATSNFDGGRPLIRQAERACRLSFFSRA